MSQKLVCESRIKYDSQIYDKGNTFLCRDDQEAAELVREKKASYYPVPTPEVLEKRYPEENQNLNVIYPKEKPEQKTKTKVSIITAIKDNLYYLKMCIKAVYLNTRQPFEYIIIDNGSGPEVKNYLINEMSQHENMRLITNKENMGYAYACNQGIKIAQYDYLCMLDADTYVSPEWLSRMLITFKKFKDCGITAPSQATNYGAVYIPFKILDIDNIQSEVSEFSKTLPEEYEEKHIFQIYGFCHLVKKEVYDEIGVYDWKRYYGLASNETDLFWRAGLRGFKLYWAKGSYVHHFHNKIKINLGMDPQSMCDKGHKVFKDRQDHPEKYFVKNDAAIKPNINLAYEYNQTYQNLKPYFNE